MRRKDLLLLFVPFLSLGLIIKIKRLILDKSIISEAIKELPPEKYQPRSLIKVSHNSNI